MPRILIVTTSHDRLGFGDDARPTGVWFEEFAVPYLEFERAGAQLTVASPRGGAMPIDPRSTPTAAQEQEWASALEASRHTLLLAGQQAADYDAVFLPGGHGPMFDLPDNADLQRLLYDFQAQDKFIVAVCHGPAGLVGAKRPADGQPLVQGKTLTSYTYEEEIAAHLDQDVPFILENRLKELGATFIAAPVKAEHVECDGKLITGQNPASSAKIAQVLLAALRNQAAIAL
ncbi:type 1 glutamine amidotransferase domain-containing protein [Hymenobacter terrenus]|uniref:type 1 glutamine amidotransferase domain-containing protein n=1 Tax=Hymenobacter terrenus TaxID=1629124 RepID=UPI000619D590|nr:type 1 glutamine amidotransferase domain-containing protein [Hymenobacter terrenus]